MLPPPLTLLDANFVFGAVGAALRASSLGDTGARSRGEGGGGRGTDKEGRGGADGQSARAS